jgi:hypothetical protein
MKYFNYFGSIKTNNTSCIREIKSRIAMAKEAFTRKKGRLFSAANWT